MAAAPELVILGTFGLEKHSDNDGDEEYGCSDCCCTVYEGEFAAGCQSSGNDFRVRVPSTCQQNVVNMLHT